MNGWITIKLLLILLSLYTQWAAVIQHYNTFLINIIIITQTNTASTTNIINVYPSTILLQKN